MAIVDTDVGGGGRRKDLALIFEAGIGLSNGDGEITGGMRLQVGVPEKTVASTAKPAKTAFQQAIKRMHHHMHTDKTDTIEEE